MGNFPSLFLATVNRTAALEYYDGRIRIVDSSGAIVADRTSIPSGIFQISRRSQRRFLLRQVSLLPALGYPRGILSSRSAGESQCGGVRGHRSRRPRDARVQAARRGAVCESFHYHLARLIEMLHCVERIEELMADAELFGETMQAQASLNRREGIGSCEAPRGTLFHRY